MIRSVYVIGIGDSPVKIGVADDVQKRVADLQVGCPFELIIHHVFHYPDSLAQHVEAAAHRALAEHNSRGEWFNVSAEVARATVERISATIRDDLGPYGFRSSLLAALADEHTLSPWAAEALGEYRRLMRMPESRAELERLNAVVSGAVGVGGLVAFRTSLMDWSVIDRALYRRRGHRAARASLARAINALSVDYAARREDDLLTAIGAA